MKLLMISVLVMAFCLDGYTQAAGTGINTRNPLGVFHVDGAGDNPATGAPTDEQAANDFIVSNVGFMGVGVINPLVKLDLRSVGPRNAFGLGNTTMDADVAGMGAVRYYAPDERIQVSDGVEWEYTYIPPVKAVVVARMGNPFSVAKNTNVPLLGWDEIQDMANNFDPVTGVFTAPRAGVYTFLLTYNFLGGPVVQGTRVEAMFLSGSSGAGTVLARSYKTFGKSHHGTSGARALDTQAGGSASITLHLAANATVRAALWQNITPSAPAAQARGLRVSPDYASSNGGFNNLTIIEH